MNSDSLSMIANVSFNFKGCSICLSCSNTDYKCYVFKNEWTCKSVMLDSKYFKVEGQNFK